MGGEMRGREATEGLLRDSNVSKLGMTTDTESVVLILSLLLLLVMLVTKESETPLTPAVVMETDVVIGTEDDEEEAAVLLELFDFFSFLLFDFEGFGVGGWISGTFIGLGVLSVTLSLGGEGLLGGGVKNRLSNGLESDTHVDMSGDMTGDDDDAATDDDEMTFEADEVMIPDVIFAADEFTFEANKFACVTDE
jgi:hypothetical protein